MRRLLILVCATSIALVACSTQDENYYRLNPQALQQAIKDCSSKQTAKLTCEQLTAIAASVSELAYQLQVNPQEFGKKILSLQQNLAKQHFALQTSPTNQAELRKIVEENQQQLAERLAIVKWLESPES